MTEAEWLVGEAVIDMLRHVRRLRGMRKQAKQRRQRLFSAACCRRVSPIGDGTFARWVEVVERFGDAGATGDELMAAESEARAAWLKDAANDALLACLQACRENNDEMHASTSAISAAWKRQANDLGEPLAGRMVGACPSEERGQCHLLRCIFGNPFRPTTLNLESRTSAIVSLARAAYDERQLPSGELDLLRLCVLADALEETGAPDEVVSHLRSPGPHYRGCWAIDAVLGLT